MLRKRYFVPVLLLVMVLFATTAYAGLHFVGGASIGSGSLIANAQISGFGNNTDTATVTLSVSGTNLSAVCQNKGGNIAPGQNPVNVSVNTSQIVSPDSNGNAAASFHVNLLPTAEVAGCPNRNWAVVDLLGYLQVTLSAFDSATGVTDTSSYDCYVNEAFHEVSCTPRSS